MEERIMVCPNISCGHCTATIQRELGALPGVVAVDAQVAGKQVIVRYQAPADWDAIRSLLEEIGFPPRVTDLPVV